MLATVDHTLTSPSACRLWMGNTKINYIFSDHNLPVLNWLHQLHLFSISIYCCRHWILLLSPALAHFRTHFPAEAESTVHHFNHSLANILIYHITLGWSVYFPAYTICYKTHEDINCVCFVQQCITGTKYNIWHIEYALNNYILNTQLFWFKSMLHKYFFPSDNHQFIFLSNH